MVGAALRQFPEPKGRPSRNVYDFFTVFLMEFFEENLDELARSAKAGDAGAAERLYRMLSRRVYGFCLSRVGDRSTAEDVTQEIFLKLARSIRGFDELKGAFAPWFWKLARSVLLDHYRVKRPATFSDLGEEAAEEIPSAERLERQAEYSMALHKLEGVLDGLSGDERQVFELRYLAELPYRDIGELTGKSEGAVRVAASRIRAKLKEHFGSIHDIF